MKRAKQGAPERNQSSGTVLLERSLTIHMKRSSKAGAAAIALLALTIGLLELTHLIRFGHCFPFGLHADVSVGKADYGIDGITKVYQAKLTNYGLMPASISVCDFVDDTFSRGTHIGSLIERWDASSKNWVPVTEFDKSGFCRPYPLGIVEAHVVRKRLWTGQSVSTGEEATAAREPLTIGDKARFVLYTGGIESIPTAPVLIDEHPIHDQIPYRVRH